MSAVERRVDETATYVKALASAVVVEATDGLTLLLKGEFLTVEHPERVLRTWILAVQCERGMVVFTDIQGFTCKVQTPAVIRKDNMDGHTYFIVGELGTDFQFAVWPKLDA